MSMCLTAFMTIYLRRENARRDASASERNIPLENNSEGMEWEERGKGDDATFYRYTV